MEDRRCLFFVEDVCIIHVGDLTNTYANVHPCTVLYNVIAQLWDASGFTKERRVAVYCKYDTLS